MNIDKKLGRLRALIHKYDCHVFFLASYSKSDFDLIKHLDQKIDSWFQPKKQWKDSYPIFW